MQATALATVTSSKAYACASLYFVDHLTGVLPTTYVQHLQSVWVSFLIYVVFRAIHHCSVLADDLKQFGKLSQVSRLLAVLLDLRDCQLARSSCVSAPADGGMPCIQSLQATATVTSGICNVPKCMS